jgi:hypothetical protein
MRKTLGVTGIMLAFTSTLLLAQAPEPLVAEQDPGPVVELVGVGTLYIPHDDDTYEAGAGMEIQGRFWLTPHIGLALAGGGASYAIDEQDIQVVEAGLLLDGELEGDVGLSTFGGSLLLRPVLTEKIALTLEGGVRYVAVDSNAELEISAVRPGSRTYLRDTLDIDDGVVAIAAATVEINVAPQVSLLGGAGYQFDLEKGDVEFLDEDLGDNELEAILIQAGVAIRF